MFSLVKSKQLDLRTLKSSPRFFSQRTWDEAKEGDFLFGFEPHFKKDIRKFPRVIIDKTTSRNPISPIQLISDTSHAPTKLFNHSFTEFPQSPFQKQSDYKINSNSKFILITQHQSPKSLSSLLKVSTIDILKFLITIGEPPSSSNHLLPIDLVELICTEFGFEVKIEIQDKLQDVMEKSQQLKANSSSKSSVIRLPMVVIMGHINHGKTSLLDSFRKTNIVDQEVGGITQRIAAFKATMPQGLNVTFLDTPGHQSFFSMRSRGVKLTDIAILVIAADEGVQEQTIEAIKHIQDTKISVIVAINKIDKPNVNSEQIKRKLLELDIVCEEYGGDVPVIEISTKTGAGLKELAEAIEIQAGLLDLRAELDGDTLVSILECRKDKQLGVVASVVCRNGKLKTGDCFITGTTWGKIRSLQSDKGVSLLEILPGEPAEILGLRDVVAPGQDLLVVKSEHEAKTIAEERAARYISTSPPEPSNGTTSTVPFDENKSLINLLLRGDSGGSVEALSSSIEAFPQDEVQFRVIQTGIGTISESDLHFAETTKSVILGYGVSIPNKLMEQARLAGLQVFTSPVIYSVIDYLQEYAGRFLNPSKEILIFGKAEVLKIFLFTHNNEVTQRIAGCTVIQGTVLRGLARVVRDNQIIFEGKIRELKHQKQSVSRIRNGSDCGISFVDWDSFQEGDIIQSIEIRDVPRKLGEPFQIKEVISKVPEK